MPCFNSTVADEVLRAAEYPARASSSVGRVTAAARAAGPEADLLRGVPDSAQRCGSNQVQSINEITQHAPVAQLDRVLGFEPSGREFESLRARQFSSSNSIQLRANALEVHATREHRLAPAQSCAGDACRERYVLSGSLQWFRACFTKTQLHGVRDTPKVKFSRKTGYDHLFGFVIPKSRTKPERIIQAINRPNRDTAQAVAFAWIDTKASRCLTILRVQSRLPLQMRLRTTTCIRLHGAGVKMCWRNWQRD